MIKTRDSFHCVHCGTELAVWDRHYNPWLSNGVDAWECSMGAGGVPVCRAGQEWYAENTVVFEHVRYYKHDPKLRTINPGAIKTVRVFPKQAEDEHEECVR